MLDRHDLLKPSKTFLSQNTKLDLTKRILCGLFTGEALYPDFYTKRQVGQALYGLRRYRFIRKTKNNNYELTQKGQHKIQTIFLDDITIKTPKYWNGKWYLVMYDLPVRFKKARNAFRWKLKDLGFVQLQKSAWVYPFPCEQEVLFTADFFGVRKHIEILEVGKILHEQKFKDHFCL